MLSLLAYQHRHAMDPQDLNVLAGDISKLVDRDDYTINDSVVFALDDLWGPEQRPVMDFSATTTPSYHNLIPGTISRCNQASIPLHKLKIGSATTTGSVPMSV